MVFHRVLVLGMFLIAELAWAEHANAPNLGVVAERLTVGANVITQVMLGICIVMGIGFLGLSFVHYKGHRQNPKLIPLGKPVMYVVLGLVLLCIPFLEEFLGDTGRSLLEKDKKKQTSSVIVQDIDAPLTPNDWINNYDH